MRASVAAEAEAQEPAVEPPREPEFYEVFIDKPLGISFGRGNDGSAYVIKVDASKGNIDDQVEVGDRVMNISASFGSDVWEAKNYGQVVYAIKTRNGEVYLRLQRNFGDLTSLQEEEMTDTERRFRSERAGGNYSAGTKEVQEKKYIERKESDRKRRELFNDALALYKKGDLENALIEFENVLALEPKNYVGDDFARVTQTYRVTQYNVACCYAAMDQVEAGLDSLASALAAGFDDFKTVRKDASLNNLRKNKRFATLVNRYDEPLINEGAIKALKNIFSFGRKQADDDE